MMQCATYSDGVRRSLAGLLLLAAMVLPTAVAAQPSYAMTNMARDFWVMFLPNSGGSHQTSLDSCTLVVTGPEAADITVASFDDSVTFHLAAGSMTEYLCGTNAEVRGRAYHVTATADVALYARNALFASHDVAMIIPTRCLGTEYIGQSATAAQGDTEMLGFVATEDSTVITVDFTNWLGYRQVPSDIEVPDDGRLRISLQRGETYILGTQQSLTSELFTWGYFGGKTITSNGRPFALFHGNSAAHVPISDTYNGTHLYEQAIPLSQWGHTYLLGGVGEQQRYYAHVTSGDDSNMVYYWHSPSSTMTRGEVYTNQQTPYSSNVASAPYSFTGRAGVHLLLSSYGTSGFSGSPSSVIVPSVEHGVHEAWFTAEHFVDYQDNYLTIFCDTACAGGLRLDGQLLSLNSTFPPEWTPDIQPYHTPIGLGVHHLEIDSGTFVAFVYGLRNGYSDSYANAVGIALDPYPRDTLYRTDSTCQYGAYGWGPFLWEEGALTESGTLHLARNVYSADTVHRYCLTLTVLPAYHSEEHYEIAPDGSLAIEDTTITTPGTYVFHHTTVGGCDSVLTVVLTYCTAPPPCVSVSRPIVDFDRPVVTLEDCTEGHTRSTWRFSDGVTLSGTSVRRQLHHPLPDSLGVMLTSCNDAGCCSDTAFALPTKIRSVWFPNAFTPDAEENNHFGATASVEMAMFVLHVYNRQGQLVYHSTDATALWDGTHDGRPLPQGAYTYRWQGRDVYGFSHSGLGTVTIIR